MNKDQMKGAIKKAVGKVEEKTGGVVGSDKLRQKGLTKEAEGSAQKKLGDAEQAARDAHKR